MRVSTKIIAGYAVLVLLMFGALGYELVLVQRMQSISSELSRTYFPVASTGIRLRDDLRYVEEFLRKHLTVNLELLPIEGYADQLAGEIAAFEATLSEMEGFAGADQAGQNLERLRGTWREFRAEIETAERAQPPGTYDSLPVRLEDQLRRMYSQVDVVNAFALESIDREMAASGRIDRQVTRVSWITAGAALLLAVGVAFAIVRSISGGLGRLTEGTRWLGAGRLTLRIPEDRNDEFGELAHSFNRMADRLEELDHLKRDFVSSVSHELKSPIAASREIVQLLLDEVPGPLNDEQKRLLGLSIRSSRRLSSMIGTLLDLARMDAGTITYEMQRQQVGEVVRSTIEELEVAIKERGLDVHCTVEKDLAVVSCDPDRLAQVLGNVIENAMKFSPRGSAIQVRAERVEPGNASPRGGVLVSVADCGPGIPDKYKELVFARFQQVRPDGARHGRGGAGLGLAICRGIMEAHGGRIWVEDNPEGGSVFRLLLPVAEASTEVQHAQARRAVG